MGGLHGKLRCEASRAVEVVRGWLCEGKAGTRDTRRVCLPGRGTGLSVYQAGTMCWALEFADISSVISFRVRLWKAVNPTKDRGWQCGVELARTSSPGLCKSLPAPVLSDIILGA